jgi:hypothetical protein
MPRNMLYHAVQERERPVNAGLLVRVSVFLPRNLEALAGSSLLVPGVRKVFDRTPLDTAACIFPCGNLVG